MKIVTWLFLMLEATYLVIIVTVSAKTWIREIKTKSNDLISLSFSIKRLGLDFLSPNENFMSAFEKQLFQYSRAAFFVTLLAFFAYWKQRSKSKPVLAV